LILCETDWLQIYAQLFGFAKYFAKYFFKEKMWGSLKSQGVAVQLPLTGGAFCCADIL
jgi:hypothetical protein